MTHAGDDTPVDEEFEHALDAEGLRVQADAPGPTDEGRWGWTPGRIVAVALLALVAGFWVWAFSPLAPNTHPDELDDPAFAAAARPRCAAAVAALEEVPRAFDAETMADRADQVDAGTAIYRALLAELAAVAPPADTSDGQVVRAWLADYAVYLDDRDRYAEQLRDDIDEAFETTVKAGRQITLPVDEFAKGNRIADCVTPLDV